MRRTVIILIAVLFVFGLAYLIVKSINPRTHVAPTIAGSDAIYVVDQPPGNIVTVAALHLSAPGFVIIRDDSSGTPGRMVGYSTLIAAGDSRNVRIRIGEELKSGQRFIAIVSHDDGDRLFDPSKDFPVRDGNGNIISIPFAVVTGANPPPPTQF